MGGSVSVSSDGAFLAVGWGTFNNSWGGTWVFRYTGGRYVEMPGMPLEGPYWWGQIALGTSVSLSSGGVLLAVGAPAKPRHSGGSVWLWRRDGSTCLPMSITAGQVSYPYHQGQTVSLSGDGSVLALWAPAPEGPDYTRGAFAWIFRTALACSQPGTFLSPSSGAYTCSQAPPGHYAPGYTGRALAPPALGRQLRGLHGLPCRLLQAAAGGESFLDCLAGSYSADAAALPTPSPRPLVRPRRPRPPAGLVHCFTRARRGGCDRTAAWYGQVVVVPVVCVLLATLVAWRLVSRELERRRAVREERERDRAVRERLQAVLDVHGIHDPEALRTVQVVPSRLQQQHQGPLS
jgi:hypothetical protein